MEAASARIVWPQPLGVEVCGRRGSCYSFCAGETNWKGRFLLRSYLLKLLLRRALDDVACRRLLCVPRDEVGHSHWVGVRKMVAV